MSTRLEIVSAQVTDHLRSYFGIELPEDLVTRVLDSSGVLALNRGQQLPLDALVEQYGDEMVRRGSWPGSRGKLDTSRAIAIGLGLAVAIVLMM